MKVSVHKQARGHAWRTFTLDVGRLHLMATVAAPGFGYRWAISVVAPHARYVGAQGDGRNLRVHRA